MRVLFELKSFILCLPVRQSDGRLHIFKVRGYRWDHQFIQHIGDEVKLEFAVTARRRFNIFKPGCHGLPMYVSDIIQLVNVKFERSNFLDHDDDDDHRSEN